MEQIITEGVSYPLEHLPERIRQKDLDFMIERGNHKSATSKDNEASLLKNYAKEVERGWMLPTAIESVKKIKGAGVIPVGVATRFTIDERGNRKVK